MRVFDATTAPRTDAVLSTDLGGAMPDLLALNNTHAEALSWLEPARFELLVSRAFFAARVGAADGFVLTFDQAADYDSPNFKWFQQRYERFVYVDRVVVAPAARGRGLATRLYAALTGMAVAAGHDLLACEVNVVPPNPGSDAFHAAMGFAEVGQVAHPGGRTVRYLTRRVGI